MNQTEWILTAVWIASASTPSLAAQPAAGSAIGPVTRASFIATMDGEYKKLDANADGVVTKLELEASQQSIAAAAASQRARTLFAQIDIDRNGQISADEFVRATVAPVKKADGADVMNRADINHDNKISAIEHRILTLAGFDRLDVDRDGNLTVAEQRAAGLVK